MAEEHSCPKCKGKKTHDTQLTRKGGTQTLYRCDLETCREQFWVDVAQEQPSEAEAGTADQPEE